MLPAYKVILPMIGTNRHIPLTYRYAPVTMQELGLPNMYSKQGASHIRMLLNHLPYRTKSGIALTLELEHMIIEIGTSCSNPLSLSFTKWGHLYTEYWL